MVEKTVTPLEMMGRNHAVDLVLELRAWFNELDLNVPDEQIGEATIAAVPDILARYMKNAHRDPTAERGFYAKLSLLIASAFAEWDEGIIRNNFEPIDGEAPHG